MRSTQQRANPAQNIKVVQKIVIPSGARNLLFLPSALFETSARNE
jgi:hypothetical protein